LKTRNLIRWALAIAVSVASTSAHAASLSFGCITGNRAVDCAIGVAQISVDVAAVGSGSVVFSFRNTGPAASSITDVYFQDGSLLALARVMSSSGVSFAQYATPSNLPGANNIAPPFVVTEGFSADSNPPVQPNGVNPGETLGIKFTLQSGQTIDDVVRELGDGSLRVGIHVQGYASGGSESFVNHPVPEPETLALLVSAGAGLRLRSARRLRSA